jgi:two-component system, OmpR family, copper resistance phosphate regulon response regulator CusR
MLFTGRWAATGIRSVDEVIAKKGPWGERGVSARILLVEDEANIAEYLVIGLREEGYAVEHAADGGSAWQRLQTEAWDLVLLDWTLPGQDGLQLLSRFRERDRQTPVLFLTARDQVQFRVLGLDHGADDYLCKPFDFEELLARVRALMRRREIHSDAVLIHGDIRIDLAGQRAERAGRALDLTAKELALLILFVRNPGRVLSRALIYEHVWNEHYYRLSNTLEMHIVELRRKLEALGPRVIYTVRGRGYSCGEPQVDVPEVKR